MVFWMRRRSRMIKGDPERKVDAAIRSANARRAIVAVALVAVLREGIEAALFLIAAGTSESGGAVAAGALAGLVLASLLAWIAFAAPVTWLFLRRTSAPRAVPVGASPGRQRVDAA
jgi:high-affinity iron transporter